MRRALARVRALLAERGVDEALLAAVELVLAEVLNNIVEHALRGRSDGWIAVSLDLRGDVVRCEVRDSGRPMPASGPPPGAGPMADSPAYRPEELPEGGFGWFLVRSLASGIVYRRLGGVNVLRFRLGERERTAGQARSPGMP